MATHRSNQPEKSQTLVSWKEIAAFLSRAERTVKRWERDRGLPVHRVPGGERGGVFAYPDELTAWLHGEQGRAAQSTAPPEPDEPENKAASANPASPELESSAPPAPRTESAGFRRLLVWMAASAAILALAGAVVLAVNHFSRAASSKGRVAQNPGASVHLPKPGAGELFLRGRYQWSLRTADSLAKSVDAYTQAIVIDPNYAQAYAGLAESYELLPEYGQVSKNDAYARAKVAADKAIELDPNLAAGHRAKAFELFWGEWDVPASDAEFQRALALAPTEGETHHWYSTTLLSRLQRADSIAQADEALRLGPTNPAIAADVAFVHAFFHDNREAALSTLREIARTQPSLVKPNRYLARLDLEDGKYTDYLADMRNAANISHNPDEVAWADAAARGWAHGGELGMLEATREVQQAAFERGTASGYFLARTYLRLGKPNEALRYFRAAYDRYDFNLMTLSACDCIASVRNTPGYAQLLRQIRERMHLPPVPSATTSPLPRPNKHVAGGVPQLAR